MAGVNSTFGLGVTVGLGTLSPTHLLHTVGSLRFQSLPNTTDTFELLAVDPTGVVYRRPYTGGSGSGALAWLLNGNTGVNDAVNFLGTINAASLIFRTTNLERARFLPNGKFGINYNAPIYQTHIHSDSTDKQLAITGLSPSITFTKNAVDAKPMFAREGKLGYATSNFDFVYTSRPKDFVLVNLDSFSNLILGTASGNYTGFNQPGFSGYERMKIDSRGFVGVNLISQNGLSSTLQTIVADRFHVRLSKPNDSGAPAQEFFRIENMDTDTGVNVVIDINGRLHRQTGGSGGSNLAWLLNGNAGVNPASNFLGTTDAADLIIKTSNTERARFLPNGELGIGYSTPTYLTHIHSAKKAMNLALTGDAPTITFCESAGAVKPLYSKEGKVGYATVAVDFVNSSSAGDFIMQNLNETGSLILGTNSQATPFNGYERLKIDNDGYVGINLISANGAGAYVPTTVKDRFHIRLSTMDDEDAVPQEFVRIENMDHAAGEYVVIDDDGRLHRALTVGDKPEMAALQTRVDELTAEVASLKFERHLQQEVKPGITYTMAQNVPNPFSDRTQISYTISGNYTSAFIAFHDENGREISREVLSKTAGDVTFATNTAPGVIFYTLVIDGQVKCTKKMVKK